MALRLATAADASLSAYFPPDTKAVAGIQLRAIAAAGLFQGIDAEIRKTAASLLEKGPLAGFDPLKDLDEVLIATSGAGDKAPAILVLRGRFPLDKLEAAAKRYRDVPILEGPEQKGGWLAFIDSGTAIAGEAEMVRAAIDRRGQDIHANAPWLTRMETLRAKCAIWGFGEGLDAAGAPAGKAGDLSSIDRFEFGVAFDRGLRLAAEVHMRTPQDAEKLTSTLRLVEAMMKEQKKTSKNTAFDIRADNQGTLRLSLILPEAELKKAMREEKTSLAAAISSGLPALVASQRMKPAAAPAEPPVPVVFRQPAPSDSKVLTNADGDAVVLTLPGNLPIKN